MGPKFRGEGDLKFQGGPMNPNDAMIFDHRKLNLIDIRHDLFFAVMDLGLSE